MRPTDTNSALQRALMNSFTRLGLAYAAAGAEFWKRSLEIGERSLRQALTQGARPGLCSAAGIAAIRSLAEVYRNGVTEISMLPPLALERLRREASTPLSQNRLLFFADAQCSASLRQEQCPEMLRQAFSESGIRLAGTVTVEPLEIGWLIRDELTGRSYSLQQEDGHLKVYGRQEGGSYLIEDKPVMLPARVEDASQGLAVYLVSKQPVQQILDADPGQPFKALNLGNDRTPLAIFIVDYRQSDLGSYHELGIAFFVAPRNDPLAIGMYIRELPVDEQLSCNAGREIWGYPKTVQSLHFVYEPGSASCALIKSGSDRPLLAITFERGGSESSHALPSYSYTMKRGMPHRTIFTRSGLNERIRLGGAGVKLVLDNHQAVASGGVWQMLQASRLTNTTPILHAWTEHMSGEFGTPYLLDGSRA